MITPSEKEFLIRKELMKRKAAESFLWFIQCVHPQYTPEFFHLLIIDACQKLAEGKIKRLMVFIPPQHGKSLLISQLFPAWSLLKNPDYRIVGCSYSSDLSMQFSRAVQRLIVSPQYQALTTETRLNGVPTTEKGYQRNADFFEIVGHSGFYKSVGVGGSLTGTPVDIAIIDDPVKDALEAYSATYRQRIWDWYNTVLSTRLHNNSRQIFIMTRWHEDDLAGRILQSESSEWEVLSIPAICEEEHDGGLNSSRHIGDALWPERHSLEKLLKQQARSPREFSALYQQRPSIDGGNIVRREWFKRVSLQEFNRVHNVKVSPMVFFVDTAYTDKTSNDPTGIISCCRIGNDLYVTDAKKVNLKFPDLIRFLPDYVNSNGYSAASSVRIEPKANGLSVIDQLRESTSLNVIPTPTPKDGKETRLNVASPCVEGGRVVLVDGAWNEDFINEVCSFPAAPHDEFVDVLCYAVDYLLKPDKSIDLQRLAKVVRR